MKKMLKNYWKYKIMVMLYLFNSTLSSLLKKSPDGHEKENIISSSEFLEDLNINYKLYNYENVGIPEEIKTHVKNRVKRWTNTHPLIVRHNQNNTRGRKHHFSTQSSEVYRLDNLENIDFLAIKDVNYIHLFLHKSVEKLENLYSVCLCGDESTHSSRLVLYELSEQGSWKLINEKKINNGNKIITQTISTGTLIIVLENNVNSTEKHYLPSPVYFLNDNKDLKWVQSLNIKQSFDVRSCLFEHTIFLAVTVPNNSNKFDEKYGALSIIFMWKGSHFDVLQNIPSRNAKILTLFPLKASLFLVLSSDKQNYDGDSRVDSKIFRYNAHTDSFHLFQRIPTSGATNIRFFKFKQEASDQYFLAVANNLDGNRNNENISVSSVVYKFEEKFVPYQSFSLNGMKQWIPVVIEPDMLVLLAHTTDGVLIFQYNGWKFIPILNHQLFNSKVNTNAMINAFVFGNHPIIVVQNEGNRRMAKFFKLNFNVENTLKSYDTNLLNMCEKTMQNVLANNISNVPNELTGDNKFIGNDLEYLEQSLILNLDTDELQQNDKIILDEMQINRINEASKFILVQMQAIQELLQGLPQLLWKKDLYIMENFQARHIILKKSINAFSDLYLNTLNTFHFNKAYKSIVLDKGKMIQRQFLIENLYVRNIEYGGINNMKRADFEQLINHIANTSGVVIKGNVFLNEGLVVNGNIEGTHISKSTTLTKTGKQVIHGTLNALDLTSKVIVSPQINDVTFKRFRDIIQMSTWTVFTPLIVKKLSIQDLTIQGLFGRSKLDEILEQSLKLHSTQEILAPFRIKNLNTIKFTPKLLDSPNFISIESDIDLPNILQFEDIHINRLILKERLNNIEVMGGILGVVILNGTEIQEVSGNTVIENVELMRSITLQGTIKSSIMNKKNPLKMSTVPLALKGNYILKGNVAIENSLTATDIVMEENKMSIARITKEALKLTEERIPIPLTFKNKVIMSNINFDKVNSKLYDSWIIPRLGVEIVLSKKKHFSNVKVTGECVAPHTINGIVLREFGGKIMRTSGDQEITGNITFQTLYMRSIQSNNSFVGGVPLNNLVTYSRAQELHSQLTIEHDIAVITTLHAGRIIVRGAVAQNDLRTLYNDTLFLGHKNAIVKSMKKFTKPVLIKKNMITRSLLSTKIEEILSALHWDKNIIVKTRVVIEQPVFIRNIHVHGTVEGIEGFGKNWLLFEGDQTFLFKQTVEHAALEDMDLTTKNINDMDLQDFSNFLRSDNDFSIAQIDVYGKLSATKINLTGLLNNVLTDDILISTQGNQYINSNYSFKGGLQMQSIHFKSLCGLTIETLNSFMSTKNECNQRLFIRGAAIFKTEPVIKSINNIHVNNVINHVWFSSQDVVLQHFIKLEQLTLTNTHHLQSINHLNIKRLASTYLSKTLEQSVSGHIHIFAITAPFVDARKVNLENARVLLLNNETIRKFTESILNIEDNQFIEREFRIQYAEINGLLNILGLINGLNFNKDVMDFGIENKISGRKVLQNIQIDNLVLGDTVFIDGVHVKDWFNNAVNRNLSNKHIAGIKHLDYTKIAHLCIPSSGALSIPENVLVQGMTQNVTGFKVFRSSIDRDVNIHFKRIYLHNILNEFPSGDFKYLVNKHDHIVYLSTEKMFLNEVIALNINVDSEKHQLQSIIKAKENVPKLSEKYIELNQSIQKFINRDLS